MIAIETVLVKIASRCNLNCDYCYVYHMGDEGWRRQPKQISIETVQALARRLAELVAAQGRPLAVVMHGGEPLLVGPMRFEEICAAFRQALPASCELALQTNGVLLSDDVVAACIRHSVGVSISLDGPASVHDRHRPTHGGRPSHPGVMKGLARLTASPEGRAMFSGVLAVIDLKSQPVEVYEALKATNAPSIDFLYRDGNHDALPVGKTSFVSTEYGDWMCGLLDHYLSDPVPTRIRVLDDMLRLLLGGRATKEGVGSGDEYGILVIETDGTVSKNDTLKSAHDGADRFDAHASATGDLVAWVRSPAFRAYHAAQAPASPICRTCPDLAVCGGGMPAHRWSGANGFCNPSVFCADQRRLIDHMRAHLRRRRMAA